MNLDSYKNAYNNYKRVNEAWFSVHIDTLSMFFISGDIRTLQSHVYNDRPGE